MSDFFEPLTQHFNVRKPALIILHGSGYDFVGTHEVLLGNTDREVSCHYFIGKDGRVEQYLDNSVRAWHAGAGYWAGFVDINSLSIGIEIECPGDDQSFEWPNSGYNEIQTQRTAELVKKLAAEYNILPHHVLGHQDVSPYRKKDPGPRFDWSALAAEGVGLWHGFTPNQDDSIVTDFHLVKAFQKDMACFGYDTRPSPAEQNFSTVIRAFQTHFLPWNVCGEVTEQSIQALDILLAKKLA